MNAKKKKQAFLKRLLLLLFILQGGIALNSASLLAQQYDIKLEWDSEVACSIYDIERKKDEFIENLDTSECLRICEGIRVNYWFSGNDIGSISSINWSVTGGTFTIHSGGLGIEVDWNSGIANGMVHMAITMSDASVLEREICIETLDSPSAKFHVLNDYEYAEACLKQEVFFNNMSVPNPGGQLVAFHWDFGDGTTSTEFEPVHSYDNDGEYIVVLTVWNECNCFSTHEMKILVKEWGVPPVISCPTVTCENSIEQYTASSKECDDFEWKVEGGTILSGQGTATIEVQWDHVDPETGFGWIYLEEKCSGGCPAPTVAKIPVVLEKVKIKGDDEVCKGSQHRFSIPKWPTTEVQWVLVDMGNTDYSQALTLSTQRNEVLITPNGLPIGTYILKAFYNNTLKKCSGIGEREIKVLGAPIEISGPKQICIGEQGEYTSTNPSNSTQWILRNSSNQVVDTQTGLQYLFSTQTAGTYSLSANQPNHCPAEGYSILVHSGPSTPQGDFDLPDEVCPSMTYTIGFDNLDPNLDPNHYIIEWSANNGEITGNTNDPVTEVVFDENPVGDYTVSIRYIMKTNPFCPSEWLISDIIPSVEINTSIEAFDPILGTPINTNTFCTSSQVNFRVDYLDADDYLWEVSPSNFASIVHGQETPEIEISLHEITPNTQTNYDGIDGTLTLKVQKCGKWLEVAVFDIVKTSAPVIDWNPPTEICADKLFTINFSATIGNLALSSFDDAILDLGNGQTFNNYVSTGLNTWAFVDVSYDNIVNGPTNYNMTLTIQGGSGCTQHAFSSHMITVFPTPIASISSNNPNIAFCEESDIPVITLSATETGGIVNVNGWNWFHNGGFIGSGPTINVNQFGSYTVEVVGANLCNGLSAPYNIIQLNCSGGVCNEWITITDASWTSCDFVEVSYNYSSPPNNVTWSVQPTSGLNFTNSVTMGAVFEAVLPGAYSVSVQGHWACGILQYSETVLVAYKSRLDYSISCNVNGGYDVTLYNDSPYVYGHQPTQSIFYVNGVPVNPSPYNFVDDYTVHVNPGTHTFKLDIADPAHPTCSSEFTIDLTSPTAGFVIPAEICEDDPFTLSVNNPNPEWQYLWSFDGTTDVRSGLDITLDRNSVNNVSLTVSDLWGCSAQHSENIHINEVDFNGSIIGYEGSFCQGDTVTLSYDPASNDSTPVNYQWIMDGNQIVGATNPTYQTTQPGLYGVKLTDSNSCSVKIDPVAVNFITSPTVLINGPATTCVGDTFILDGYTSNQAVERRWLLDGAVIAPWSSNTPLRIEDTFNIPGVYTYTLQVGGDCPNETDFILEVFPNPTQADVNFEFDVQCEPFRIRVMISNPDPNGAYNWSNGDNGTITTVLHSGALGVTYTNANGCSVRKEVEIPQLPQEHMWVFPTGCVEACKSKHPDAYVIGPLPEFAGYAWLWNSNGSGGSGVVPPEDIQPMGDLQLELAGNFFNTYCKILSDPLHVFPSKDCEPCKEKLKIEVEKIYIDQNNPFLSYIVDIHIGNPYPFPVTLQLSSTEGIYIPGSITLGAWQAQSYSLSFIPNSGFVGGPSSLSIQILRNGKFYCQQSEDLRFPRGRKINTTSIGGEAKSSVIPNPVENSTTVYYDFGESQEKGGTVTVYSLSGVSLRNMKLENNIGQVELEISDLSSGTYIVVLQSQSGYKTQHLMIKK